MSAVGEGLLTVEGVYKAFAGETALRGVDLELRAGSIHALIGLNGAGKTTLMRVMLGMIAPDEGVVTLRTWTGQMPVARVPAAAWSEVGHFVEAPFAYPELTVTETIVAAARLRGMSRRAAADATQTMIDRLALRRWADRRAHTLSLGNRQRLGLACALVHGPRVVVLDEPANALDPAGVLLIRTLLQDAAAAGAAVFVSSHHLDEVARLADTITVMHRGRVIGTLPPDGIDLERRFFAMLHTADASRAAVVEKRSR